MAAATAASAADTETKAVGTVSDSNIDELTELCTGLSGTSGLDICIHEITLKNQATPPVELRLQRLLSATEVVQTDVQRWEAFTETVLFRGGIKDLPVGVRAVSRSNCSGKLVPSFWKAMGLTQTGESLRAGKRYFIEMVEQNLKVDVVSLSRLEEPGNIASAKQIGQGFRLVEVRCLTGSGGFQPAVDAIGKLDDLLQPLVHLQKA